MTTPVVKCTWITYNPTQKCRWLSQVLWLLNTLRPRQNGRRFADDIFKCIFMNENVSFPIKISLKFVPKGLINNIPSLFQIMAWRRPGNKPLSETINFSLPTHICVARPQWVKTWRCNNMEMHSALLALCEGNPPVTSSFPSQWATNVELIYFLWC